MAVATAQIEGYSRYQKTDFRAIDGSNPTEVNQGYGVTGSIETQVAEGYEEPEIVITLDMVIPNQPVNNYVYSSFMQIQDWDGKSIQGTPSYFDIICDAQFNTINAVDANVNDFPVYSCGTNFLNDQKRFYY